MNGKFSDEKKQQQQFFAEIIREIKLKLCMPVYDMNFDINLVLLSLSICGKWHFALSLGVYVFYRDVYRVVLYILYQFCASC